jgi:hypothetical protein
MLMLALLLHNIANQSFLVREGDMIVITGFDCGFYPLKVEIDGEKAKIRSCHYT